MLLTLHERCIILKGQRSNAATWTLYDCACVHLSTSDYFKYDCKCAAHFLYPSSNLFHPYLSMEDIMV